MLRLRSITYMDDLRLGRNGHATSLKGLHIHRRPGDDDSVRHCTSISYYSIRVFLEHKQFLLLGGEPVRSGELAYAQTRR